MSSVGSLTIDVWQNVLGYCSLKTKAFFTTQHSRFNRLITSPFFMKHQMSPRDLAEANAAFLLKYLPHLPVRCLYAFRFQQVTREQVGSIPETDANRLNVRVAKLGSSLADMEQEFMKRARTCDINKQGIRKEYQHVFLEQIPYFHLLSFRGQSADCIERVMTSPPEKFQEFFALSEADRLEVVHECLSCSRITEEQKKRQKLPAQAVSDWFALAPFPRQHIFELFTILWSKYDLKHLSHMDEGRFSIPTDIFKAFCLAASKQQHNFGLIESWILGNEHVKSLTPLLLNRKVELMDITLTEDVEPETIWSLFEALSLHNAESDIRIYFYKGLAYRKTFTPEVSLDMFKKCQEALAAKGSTWQLRVIGKAG